MPKACRMAPIFAVAALFCCVLRIGDAEARARKASPRSPPAASAVLADEADCVAKEALEASDCHNAALNSHAEYEEKAPRLASNEACTRFFGAHNCSMRIGGGLQGIAFLPSYRGFHLVQGKSGGETLVLPVIAGADAGLEFAPRPVSRLDMAQDGARGARAQAAWQNMHAPVIGSARGGGILRYREAPKGAAPDLSDDQGAEPSGPAATIPVKPSMLKSMQEEMRKYGTPPK
jgi:hypothetical protein